MIAKSHIGTLIGSLLIATALTPAHAADMTNDRALNPQREPQNWILHHGNYQGHRFSQLKEINADTVKNLKPVFTVALSGFQSGGRYAFGKRVELVRVQMLRRRATPGLAGIALQQNVDL